jgi:hypothetical protein
VLLGANLQLSEATFRGLQLELNVALFLNNETG